MSMEPKKTFELGVYTFGNTPRTADGGYGPTAQAIRDALEAVQVAEEVGLDFFGFGEHHTRSMPVSSPTSFVVAAAAATRTIKLGTTVSVLSTDEPIRVFQQLATAAALAPGRVDVVAGRGGAGPSRDTLVVPRPEEPLRIWLGTGGSPASVMRAVELGLPMFLGILSGTPEHWAQYGHAYRAAWAEAGHPADAADIAVAVHGFVGEDDRAAKATYLEHEFRMFEAGMAKIGRSGRAPAGRARDLETGGMVFAGGPNEVAERVLHLHELL